jgi:hypothetical protein
VTVTGGSGQFSVAEMWGSWRGSLCSEWDVGSRGIKILEFIYMAFNQFIGEGLLQEPRDLPMSLARLPLQ